MAVVETFDVLEDRVGELKGPQGESGAVMAMDDPAGVLGEPITSQRSTTPSLMSSNAISFAPCTATHAGDRGPGRREQASPICADRMNRCSQRHHTTAPLTRPVWPSAALELLPGHLLDLRAVVRGLVGQAVAAEVVVADLVLRCGGQVGVGDGHRVDVERPVAL